MDSNNLEKKLFNRKYSWEDSYILFFENGEMNAFGKGKYISINEYLAKADFGRQQHLLKFNLDYSQFISIRRGDFQAVKGKFFN